MPSKKTPQKRHQWTEAEKEALVDEFNAAPEGERVALLAGKGISRGWFYRLRKGSRSKPSTAVTLHNGSRDHAALLAEYEALPQGSKGQWLKSHGLYKSWASNVRSRLSANGHSSPTTNRAARSQPLPVHVLPQATPGPLVTLEDAINAMQVRQDHMAEFLDMLKRMSRGQL